MTANRPQRHCRRRRRAALLATLLLPLAATMAARAEPPVAAADAGMFEALRAQDLRIATIGHRLVTANLPLCRDVDPQPGLVIHDTAQYDPEVRAAASAFFDLGGGSGIEAVVPGSAGARAGFQPNDRLISIGGVPLGHPPVDSAAKASPARLERALSMLRQALSRGPATIEILRGGRRMALTLAPTPGCRSQFELMTADEYNSWADGSRVGITSAMAEFAADDHELAALMAHELAHNIYGHPARLRAAGVPKTGPLRGLGKNGARVRETEIEADRASVYLMAAAGYDIDAAPRFWRRFRETHGVPRFLSDGTHPDTRTRLAVLSAAVADVRAKRARGAALEPDGPLAE